MLRLRSGGGPDEKGRREEEEWEKVGRREIAEC